MRPRTADRASPATSGRWCSCGTRCPASAFARGSPSSRSTSHVPTRSNVLAASAHRVVPPCPAARPGGCGGCDWQHADAAYQRDIKAAIVMEQLRRLAGIDRSVVVEALPGNGFGWRTRVRFAVDGTGRAGFRRHRSHQVEVIERCPIAHPLVEAAGVESARWDGVSEVEVAASVGSGERLVRTAAGRGATMRLREGGALSEDAAGRSWRVSPGGFWQVHPSAADVLTEAVMTGLRPRVADRALDLYAGVGLFAGSLAVAVGPAATSPRSSRRRSRPRTRRRIWPTYRSRTCCEPMSRRRWRIPSSSARSTSSSSTRRAPVPVRRWSRASPGCARARSRTLHVTPRHLRVTVASFSKVGYVLHELRAFDMFPQTHHVECVAILTAATDWDVTL